MVPIEVSLNEPIGADADVAVGDRSLRVSTPDGIVAEKLRAFCSRKGRSAIGTGPKTSRTRRTSYVGAPLSISSGISTYRSTKQEFYVYLCIILPTSTVAGRAENRKGNEVPTK